MELEYDGARRGVRPGTLLGRDPVCHLQVRDASVSRVHAVIEEVDGRLVVRDLGSANGTRVNGELGRCQPLSDGDRLSLGSLVMRCWIAPSPAPPPQTGLLRSSSVSGLVAPVRLHEERCASFEEGWSRPVDPRATGRFPVPQAEELLRALDRLDPNGVILLPPGAATALIRRRPRVA